MSPRPLIQSLRSTAVQATLACAVVGMTLAGWSHIALEQSAQQARTSDLNEKQAGGQLAASQALFARIAGEQDELRQLLAVPDDGGAAAIEERQRRLRARAGAPPLDVVVTPPAAGGEGLFRHQRLGLEGRVRHETDLLAVIATFEDIPGLIALPRRCHLQRVTEALPGLDIDCEIELFSLQREGHGP